MTAVLERAELEASPLADLHAIADQIGLDGFRRLRKTDLIDAILDRTGDGATAGGSASGGSDPAQTTATRGEREPRAGRRRPLRARRARASSDADGEERDGDREERDGEAQRGAGTARRGGTTRSRAEGRRADAEREGPGGDGEREGRGGDGEREGRGGDGEREGRGGDGEREGRGGDGEREGRGGDGEREGPGGDGEREGPGGEEEREPRPSRRRPTRARRAGSSARDREPGVAAQDSEPAAAERGRGPRTGSRAAGSPDRSAGAELVVEGVVELLGNGSAFLRVAPPDASDEDAYISAAQVRRCELVSGDRVSGPVRTPRHSERYPSLARVDTINGASAESVAEGTRYEDLPVGYPVERLELDPQDPSLAAIEWLTPIGLGSRAVIVGAARAGKTETLRRLLQALSGREGLEVLLALSGVRPEEIALWREGPIAPAAALSFAASAELQGQTVEHVVETAKRVAARGGNVVVLIDSLDALHPHVARRVLANARNLTDGGSLTVIATATRPFGGENTVIALDVALTSTGRLPALDLLSSGTVRPELLVGEDGAAAITKARASAIAAPRD